MIEVSFVMSQFIRLSERRKGRRTDIFSHG